MSWLLWVLIAGGLAIGEVLTPGAFFLGPLAVAAVAAALAGALAGGVAALIVFIVAAVLSLLVLRPIARKHIRQPMLSRTGIAALSGRTATVLRDVDGQDGLVRIGGEEWTARTYVDGQAFPAGTQVHVVEIQGATALVAE